MDLEQPTSNQPDYVMSNLPHTDDYVQSYTATFLPSLEIDEEYIL